jgi:hypothetical protein
MEVVLPSDGGILATGARHAAFVHDPDPDELMLHHRHPRA